MSKQEQTLIAPISNRELERRWAALRTVMAQHDVQAVVVQNHNDFLGGYVRWLTGVPATNAYPRSAVFFADGPMVVVEQGAFDSQRTPDLDELAMRGVGEWFGSPSYSAAGQTARYDGDIVIRALRRRSTSRVALVNPAGMYFPFGEALATEFGPQGIVDITNDVDRLKAVKSAEELDYVRQSAALQDRVMEAVRGFIQPGMRDFEIAAFAQHTAQMAGSEQGIFLAGSAPAGKAAVFRPRPLQGRTMARGDCFTLLVEVNGPSGYYTEIARTFVLGSPPAELEDGLANAIEAQQHTLSLLVPGANSRDVFASHNAFMRARGLPEENRLHCHGQGYDMVERPLVRFDEDMQIAPGMNIVVHPGYVTDKVFAVICDNYLIGEDGPLPCIHKTPQTLICV